MLYVGNEVSEFDLEPLDRADGAKLQFFGLYGSAGRPMPVLLGPANVYLPRERVRVPVEAFTGEKMRATNWANAYDYLEGKRRPDLAIHRRACPLRNFRCKSDRDVEV